MLRCHSPPTLLLLLRYIRYGYRPMSYRHRERYAIEIISYHYLKTSAADGHNKAYIAEPPFAGDTPPCPPLSALERYAAI